MNQPRGRGLSTTTIVLLVIGGAVLLPCLGLCTCSTCATLTTPMATPADAPDPLPGEVPSPPAPAPIAPGVPSPPAVSPCASLEETPLPDLSERVAIEVAADVGPDRRVTLAVRTNLPSGTRLMGAVEGSQFHGQSRMEVAGACTSSGPYGPSAGLPDGEYTASVLMPVPGVQPAGVQAVIGRRGEHLRGPQVRRRSGSVTVEAEVPVAVGLPERAAQSDRETRAERRAVHAALGRLLRRARGMDGLRRREDPEGLRRCGDTMRAIQREARQLEQRANAVHDPALAGAARSLQLCGSCSPSSADQFCPIVAETLRDYDPR